MIQPTRSRKKFLRAHWDSLFGIGFMTIDTLFGKRFYLLVILELRSRKIVRFDLTEYPVQEFVKQRIELFSEEIQEEITLIHDNAPQFTSIDFDLYKINGVNVSLAAPNMNSYTERVIGTIRREAFDHFLLFSEKQIRKILQEYVNYYNHMRPHQGIRRIPDKLFVNGAGSIKKEQILGGLHHNYYRSSA